MAASEFTLSFLLLQQEGYLFSTSLTSGLTALRRASVHEKGAFYSAFFHLSIGLERLLKTTIIIDHMLDHSLRPPDVGTVKKFGHKLRELYDKADAIAKGRSHGSLRELPPADLTTEIVSFLDDFAQGAGARYFNINALSASSGVRDPLEQWDRLIKRILEEDVSCRAQKRILQQAEASAAAIGDALVIMSGLDKVPLTAHTALLLPGLHELSSRYAVYRILEILEPLKELLSGLSSDAAVLSQGQPAAVPHMHEFLEWVWLNKSVVLRKKRWP